MLYRDSPHHEIEIVMSFKCSNLFKTNELTEYYYTRRPNDKNNLFEIDNKKHIFMGEKIVSFETTDKIVE